MTYRYASKWAYIELVTASVMTLAVYVGLQPEWWGWLLYSPFVVFLVYEGVRKVRYSLTIDGDVITVGSFSKAEYSVFKIASVNVWDAKAGRIAVVDFSDGDRFSFPSRLEGFDELVGLLKTKPKLPVPLESW